MTTQPTTSQEVTMEALRTFAVSGSYFDPHPADPRILVVAQGYNRAVAITRDGRPFKNSDEAVDWQQRLDNNTTDTTGANSTC